MKSDDMRALLDSHHRAVIIADALFHHNILQRKIAPSFLNEDEKSMEIYNAIGRLIAETDGSIDLERIDGGVRSVICDLYFNDLKLRGPEWTGAKFEQEFREQREAAEEQLRAG